MTAYTDEELEGWQRISVAGAGEASWCAMLERNGVEVRLVDVVAHYDIEGNNLTQRVEGYVPEWAMCIMETTHATQGGLRRRAIKLCVGNETVARAVQAAHRLGGQRAVWSLLVAHLYDLDSTATTGERATVHDGSPPQRWYANSNREAAADVFGNDSVNRWAK